MNHLATSSTFFWVNRLISKSQSKSGCSSLWKIDSNSLRSTPLKSMLGLGLGWGKVGKPKCSSGFAAVLVKGQLVLSVQFMYKQNLS